MDGSNPGWLPPPSTRGYAELRECAPVLFGEATDLARQYPEELGEFPHVLELAWVIAQALPKDRANLIPAQTLPTREEMAGVLRIISWKGNLRAKYGCKITFAWPGELIQELESGLAAIAQNGTTPHWKEAAQAAYDLFLRICLTIFHEFEIT